jgi:ribonuclease P protein component
MDSPKFSETTHETHLPAFRRAPQAHPRVPRPHGNPRRPCRHQCAPRQGPQTLGCLSLGSLPALAAWCPDHCRVADHSQDRSQDFERARRILKTDEFSSVFNLRPAFRTAHFVLYVRPNSLSHARLGIVAAKRLAPRAVTRNTIKRVAREAFRVANLPAVDCVLRLGKPVNAKSGSATAVSLKRMLRVEFDDLFDAQRLAQHIGRSSGGAAP